MTAIMDDDKFTDELLRMMDAESHFEMDELSESDSMLGCESSEDEPENDNETADSEDVSEPLSKRNSEFKWTSDRFEPNIVPFTETPFEIDPILMLEGTREIDYFLHYFDPDIMLQIVESINQTYREYIDDQESSSHLKKWNDLTVPEFYIFLTLCMLMTRNKRTRLDEHWSTDHLLYSPIFGTLMNRTRFSTLLYLLRKPTMSTDVNIIDILIHHARTKFKTVVTSPSKNLSVNETIVPFKGVMTRHDMKKTGIKLFMLRDLKTNIIHDFTLYFGGEKTDQFIMNGLRATETVIASLLKDYYNTYRHLYVDERYTSPRLFKYLYENGIYACGKTTQKKAGMPHFIKNLKQYEVSVGYCQPLTAIQWHSHRHYTYMLTTVHNDAMLTLKKRDQTTGNFINKPKASIDYSKIMNMNFADNSEFMMSTHRSLCPLHWHKKLLFHVVDMHSLNAFNCWRMTKDPYNRTSYATFQLRLIRQLIEMYNGSTISIDRPVKRNINNSVNTLPAAAAQHMPTKADKYQRCKVCSRQKKRRDTKLMCAMCQVYLCACPCFQIFHQGPNTTEGEGFS
ncbi:piggyBac transposable element-derived protein 4-like [Leguminivora glycinivorella]|uniref:piggyBac transposable element-derived protein 4-like n=1 Tax=Leguminivora glycinivorella TaxID=1035111 RepID=UPI00200F4484|nr:piggyBac transposable element-derived protein 4-like [Leguminivora glycinivorella]